MEINLIEVKQIYDKYRNPIVCTGTLISRKNKVVPWSSSLFDSNKKSLPKRPQRTSSSGNPVSPFEQSLDASGKQIKLEEPDPDGKLSALLVDSSNNVCKRPDDLFDKNGSPSIWDNPIYNSDVHPLSGLGTPMSNDKEPITWTLSLLDSRGEVIDSPNQLFDEKDSPLTWPSPLLDTEGKAIPGTGSLTDSKDKPVSWIGAPTDNLFGGLPPIDPLLSFDPKCNKLTLNKPLYDAYKKSIIGTGNLTNPQGKVVPWSSPLFDSNKEPLKKAEKKHLFLRMN
jgi:hypothetical protein